MPAIIGTGSGGAPGSNLFVKRSSFANVGAHNPAQDWCLNNPPCPCDGSEITPITPGGADVTGTSGKKYRLKTQFGKLALPPGAKVLRSYCITQPICCITGVGHKVPCCPYPLPNQLTGTLTGSGAGACLTGSYVLTWDNAAGGWIFTGPGCGGTLKLSLLCIGGNMFLQLDMVPSLGAGCVPLLVGLGHDAICAKLTGALTWTGANGDCFPSQGQGGNVTVSIALGDLDGLQVTINLVDVLFPSAVIGPIEEGCEEDPACSELECGIPQDLSACGCPALPGLLWATIVMPACPALDGLTVPCLYSAGAWCTAIPDTFDPNFCLDFCLSCPYAGMPGTGLLLGDLSRKRDHGDGQGPICIPRFGGAILDACAQIQGLLAMNCLRPSFWSGTITVQNSAVNQPCACGGNPNDTFSGQIFFSE